jgi:hypothetical protein
MRFHARLGGAPALAAISAAAALLAPGCGEDEGEKTAPAGGAKPKPQKLAKFDPSKNPEAVTCGHVRDKVNSANLTRETTFTLADREKIKGLNRLQASQSIFFAMTEVCKGKADDFRPAEEAVEGVRSGKYRAKL